MVRNPDLAAEEASLESLDQLHIEMGYPCNVRCIMCFQQNFTQRMDAEIWKETLLPVYPYPSRVLIQGGEPTVLRECRELIDRILSVNPAVKFGVFTNGMLFDEYWRETFIRHGYEVNFSLNGASREVHEKINKNSRYEKVMDNLTRLIHQREETGSDLAIYTSFVIIPQNVLEIPDFIDLAARLGIHARFFHDPTWLPEASEQVDAAVARGFAAAEACRDRVSVEGLATFYRYYCKRWKLAAQPGRTEETGVPLCRAPWAGLYVDRLGRVRFCCMSNLTLGDAHRDSIERIWNNRRSREFRRRMAAGDYRYCQAACTLNRNPTYKMNPLQASYYIDKFVSEFRSSPRLAIRKAARRIRQFI